MRGVPWLALIVFASACGDNLKESLDYVYDGDPVVCGEPFDDYLVEPNFERIQQRMQVAADHGWVLNLYAHSPTETVSLDALERVLTMIDDAHLSYVTYETLATLPTSGSAGVALSFDDHSVGTWYAHQDLLLAHHATVSYFVSDYPNMTAEEHAQLQEIAAMGHVIESHTVDHYNAVEYEAGSGVQAYVDNEVVPEIEALRADGYNPTAFAYPFGSRDDALDAAILQHAAMVRTTPGPCPR